MKAFAENGYQGTKVDDVASELDVEMAASMLDWLAGGVQDALVTKELDPGLFHRHPDPELQRATRIDQFVDLLRRAFGPNVSPG